MRARPRVARVPGGGLAVPPDDQRRVRRPATARRDPGLAELHSAGVLGDVPEQPRRDASVLRGRDRGDPRCVIPKRRAPRARAGPKRMGRIMVTELVRRGVFSPSALATTAVGCVLNERNRAYAGPRRLRCEHDPVTGRIVRAIVSSLVALLVLGMPMAAPGGRRRRPVRAARRRQRQRAADQPGRRRQGPRRGQVHDRRPSSRSTRSTSTRSAWARPAR